MTHDLKALVYVLCLGLRLTISWLVAMHCDLVDMSFLTPAYFIWATWHIWRILIPLEEPPHLTAEYSVNKSNTIAIDAILVANYGQRDACLNDYMYWTAKICKTRNSPPVVACCGSLVQDMSKVIEVCIGAALSAPEGVPGWFRCCMLGSRPSATKIKVLQSYSACTVSQFTSKTPQQITRSI